MGEPITSHQHPAEAELTSAAAAALPPGSGRWVAWSSFGFALLQSICVALIALSGLRTAIGLSSLLVAGGIYPAVLRFHADTIRVPMMIFASVGSILNLFVLWQIRHLRHRPSAAWRRVPISARQARSERLQTVLSVVTLLLVAAEFFTHRVLHP